MSQETITFYFAGGLAGAKTAWPAVSLWGGFMVCQWGQLLDGLFPADLH